MLLKSSRTLLLTSLAVVTVFLTAKVARAEPTQLQYELVMSSVYRAIDTQKANIAKAQSYIANPATQPAGAALLKASSDRLDRYNNLLLQTNKARIERKDPPMAAIDLALSDSAATNSALVAAKNYDALARNAQNFATLIQLQRGVSSLPSAAISSGPIATTPPNRKSIPIVPNAPAAPRGVTTRMPANAPILNPPAVIPSAGTTSR